MKRGEGYVDSNGDQRFPGFDRWTDRQRDNLYLLLDRMGYEERRISLEEQPVGDGVSGVPPLMHVFYKPAHESIRQLVQLERTPEDVSHLFDIINKQGRNQRLLSAAGIPPCQPLWGATLRKLENEYKH